MAILAVDEVMLREPRLLVPGKAPLGRVVVNTRHPLVQGLRYLFVAHPGKPLYWYNGTPAEPTGGAYVCGVGNGVDGVYQNGNGSSQYFYPWTGTFSFPMSTVSRCFTRSPTTRQTVYGDWNAAGVSNSNQCEFTGYARPAGELAVTCENKYIPLISPAKANVIYTTGVVLQASARADGYLDGVKKGSVIPNTSFSGTQVALGRGGAYAGQYVNGGILYFAVWAKALSDGHMCSLTADPYQFLIPA